MYVDYVGRLERISRTSRSKPFWKLPQLPVEIRLLQHEEAAAKHRQPNVHPRAAREDKSWRAAALEHLGTSWKMRRMWRYAKQRLQRLALKVQISHTGHTWRYAKWCSVNFCLYNSDARNPFKSMKLLWNRTKKKTQLTQLTSQLASSVSS